MNAVIKRLRTSSVSSSLSVKAILVSAFGENSGRRVGMRPIRERKLRGHGCCVRRRKKELFAPKTRHSLLATLSPPSPHNGRNAMELTHDHGFFQGVAEGKGIHESTS